MTLAAFGGLFENSEKFGTHAMESAAGPNPLLEPWTKPFGLPPFGRLRPAHFKEAFECALAEAQAEVAAIAACPEPPTFENTVEALERSGGRLRRISSVFFTLTGADTSSELEAVEREIAPRIARHHSEIHLNGDLFRRIEALQAQRGSLGLNEEQARVLERYHTAFVRAGAGCSAATKERLAGISERLAALGTRFAQNVLADETSYLLILEDEDLPGLPPSLISAAQRDAASRGAAGKYAITLSRSSIEPFLQFSARRDLREKAFRAWARRGESEGATDNRAIAAEMIELRAEQARLLGFESFAHYRLADTMARTPEAALNLLHSVWRPALAKVREDEEALQRMAASEGGNFVIAPWDWRYYAEKRRKAEFDFDESTLKPYLQLENMIEAAFFAASRLFGLSFTERRDVPLYHQDARAWTVKARDGRELALFIGDYFARPSKHSGAWMNCIRGQHKLDGDVRPVVVNVMNFVKPGEGEPCLLSFDDARTLFHEFGHALHGILSDVTYPLISGTNVARDFVEFPSQLFEHWLEQPEVLRRFARHYETDKPIPDALLERLRAARQFNQGFAAVEYAASALVDLALHLETGENPIDIVEFENKALAGLGMPAAIAMRHRTPHFQHIFAGDWYAAGYYSYLWSEVLDADGFEAFEESGDIFSPSLAAKLETYIYSSGNVRAPEEAYAAFRGRPPNAAALLRKRGFAAAAGAKA